jgi:hypothetical protein
MSKRAFSVNRSNCLRLSSSLHNGRRTRIAGPLLHVCARHRDAANQNRCREHPCPIDNKDRKLEDCGTNASVGRRHANSTAFGFGVGITGNQLTSVWTYLIEFHGGNCLRHNANRCCSSWVSASLTLSNTQFLTVSTQCRCSWSYDRIPFVTGASFGRYHNRRETFSRRLRH